jgi:hypothetical protein
LEDIQTDQTEHTKPRTTDPGPLGPLDYFLGQEHRTSLNILRTLWLAALTNLAEPRPVARERPHKHGPQTSAWPLSLARQWLSTEWVQHLIHNLRTKIQRRLDDYAKKRSQDIRTTTKNILHTHTRRVERQAARSTRPTRLTRIGPRTSRQILIDVRDRKQLTLDNTPGIRYIKARKNLPRRKKPKTLPRPSTKIPKERRTAYQVPEYYGSILDLFSFYDFDKWDNHRDVLASYRDPNKVVYPFSSLLKAQITMCKRQNQTFTELVHSFREIPLLVNNCGLRFIPSRKMISRTIDRYGCDIYYQIYRDMATRCMDLGLAPGRVVALDGTLIKSGCSPYPGRGFFTDLGADTYVRNGVLRGVGHLLVDCVDLETGLPLYSERFKGSRHEAPLAVGVLDGFCDWYGFYPQILVLDKGHDSDELVEQVEERGVEVYVQSREYLSQELMRISDYWTVRLSRLRPEAQNPVFLRRVFSLRTEVERNFARKKTCYRWDRMPNRGISEAEFYIAVCSITSLLTALTAYHVGRPDLVCAPKAFSRLNTALT